VVERGGVDGGGEEKIVRRKMGQSPQRNDNVRRQERLLQRPLLLNEEASSFQSL